MFIFISVNWFSKHLGIIVKILLKCGIKICYRGEFRACNKDIQIPVQCMKKKCFTASKVKLHDEFDCLSEIGHAPSVGVNLLRLSKYLCLIFQSHQYHNYHARHLEGNFKLGVYIKLSNELRCNF